MAPGGLPLKDYIETRAVEIANYIVENNATVRQTAKQFGVSKSTVHAEVTIRNGFGGQSARLLPHRGSKGHPFGTRLCSAKCSVLYAPDALLRDGGGLSENRIENEQQQSRAVFATR